MASIIIRRRNQLARLCYDRHLQNIRSRFLETLAYEEVRISEDKPYTSTALVLHGLLGSGRNWRSFSRNLASHLTQSSPSSVWRMVLVDLRNHGRSAEIGFDPPHDLVNAAKDLAHLVRAKGWDWPDVVIGHSMGGKVGLQYVESCVNGDFGDYVALPKQLWVLDSVPGEVSPRNNDDEGEVEKVLKTLQTLPSSVPSRKWVVNHMMELGFSKSLSDWIGSNLKKSGDHETWAFNLDGAVQMFNSYRYTFFYKPYRYTCISLTASLFSFNWSPHPSFAIQSRKTWHDYLCRERSYWSLLEHPPVGTEIAMVVAEKSDRWDTNTKQRLDTLASRQPSQSHGKLFVTVLPKAGHWVHVDNPKGLLEIIAPKMAALA
ncbi:hypothetical protein QQ045_033636 [Rhodiola kirilowii]